MKKPLRIANMGAEGEIVGRPPSPVSSSPGEDLRLNDLHHLGGSVVNPTKSTAGPGGLALKKRTMKLGHLVSCY